MRKYQPKSPNAFGRELRAIKAACEESNKPQVYMNKARRDYECTTVKFCKTNGTPKFPGQPQGNMSDWILSDEETINELRCTQLHTEGNEKFSYTFYGWM